MLDQLYNSFININITYIYILIGAFILLFLISLIKKAVKLAVLMLSFILLLNIFGYFLEDIQKNYLLSVKNGTIQAALNGEMHEIKISDIEKIKINEENKITIYYEINGTEKTFDVKVPELFLERIKEEAVKKGIEIIGVEQIQTP